MTKRKQDPDAPEWTEEMFARAKRGPAAAPPGFTEAFAQARKARSRERGPQKEPTKRLVSLRLSSASVDAYRSTGRGWQSRLSDDVDKAAKKLTKAKSAHGG